VVAGEEHLHRPEVPELVETVRMRQAARIVEELNPLLLRARDGDRPALARPDGRARPRRGAPGRALRRPADVTAPGAAPRPASELPTRIQPLCRGIRR